MGADLVRPKGAGVERKAARGDTAFGLSDVLGYTPGDVDFEFL